LCIKGLVGKIATMDVMHRVNNFKISDYIRSKLNLPVLNSIT